MTIYSKGEFSALAKTAAEKFPDAKVMNADASDEVFLKEEGITSYDLAICCTHNHEMNMILAAYLESLGVKQTVSLVASSAFAQISEKLGIDVSVPLRDTVVDSIMSHLRGKSVKEIHTVTNGELEILECEISPNSKNSGKMLKEISVDCAFYQARLYSMYASEIKSMLSALHVKRLYGFRANAESIPHSAQNAMQK